MMSAKVLKTGIAVACLAVALSGCGTFSKSGRPHGKAKNTTLTPGMVKKTINTGVTTQTEIVAAFGAPNIVTRDKAGHEVWTYDVQSVRYSASSSERSGSLSGTAGGVITDIPAVVGGAGGMSGTRSGASGQVSSSTFTLMITFDENEVVQDYKMMSTQF